MTKSELENYKSKLLTMRTQILSGSLIKPSEEFHVSRDDLSDETDLASCVINQEVIFNIRSRELHKLRLVEAALQRIEEGIYGLCDDCDEEIGNQRLTHQPWTNLCIIHAEEREREYSKYARNTYM